MSSKTGTSNLNVQLYDGNGRQLYLHNCIFAVLRMGNDDNFTRLSVVWKMRYKI